MVFTGWFNQNITPELEFPATFLESILHALIAARTPASAREGFGKKQRNEMRALYFRYRRDCLSAAELAFIWRQSTHSPSLSQRSTCNLALSAKTRPYRSFTHHPRKTTFFKRLLVKHESDSFRSIGSTIPSYKHIVRSVYSHCGTTVAPSVFRQPFF